MPRLTAKADYTREVTLNFSGSDINHYSEWIDVSSAVSLTVTEIDGSISNWWCRYQLDNTSSYHSFTVGTPIDVSANNTIRFNVRASASTSTTLNYIKYTIVLTGSDPDLGVKSQEQRYNTNTLYSADFTQSNSLPLIYSGSLFLSDFTPNGNCNSIQVDGSTVGGDQLEWRLNLGQSGIDGQSAWVPIGFKLPIEVGAFDEHSIQLRMKDPNDPTQYYQLQPSELSMCSVTYGFMTDVYLSLPPAEYQTLPSEEMPTFPTYTVPTAPDVSQYVSAPASVLTSIFNMFMASPVAIVFTLLIFAFIIKCVIW